MEISLWQWLGFFLLLFLLIFWAYAVVRAGSFAYFRTKLEYIRQMMKEMKGEENGES